jgi:hypothetical protein
VLADCHVGLKSTSVRALRSLSCAVVVDCLCGFEGLRCTSGKVISPVRFTCCIPDIDYNQPSLAGVASPSIARVVVNKSPLYVLGLCQKVHKVTTSSGL